jgi:hypothetical protein
MHDAMHKQMQITGLPKHNYEIKELLLSVLDCKKMALTS